MTISRGLVVFSLLGAAQITSAPLFAFPPSPHKGTIQLSAGYPSTCAVLADRFVSCWGDGTSNLPAPVAKIRGAASVAVGRGFSCALLLDGTVNCWGFNSNGQLGRGTFSFLEVDPAPVLISVGHSLGGVVAITAGDEHACALRSDGIAFCWGSNSDGQLGNWQVGIGKDFNLAVAVTIHDGMTNPALTGIESISAGRYHTCATLGEGAETGACWGSSTYGALGNSAAMSDMDSPVTVEAPDGTALGLIDKSITTGLQHSCAILPEGLGNSSVACWGENQFGQGGNPFDFGSYSSTPAAVLLADGVTKLKNVRQVQAGLQTTCALLADSSARCWGRNDFGELGNSAETDAYTVIPETVTASGTTLTGFTSLTVGGDHVCGVTETGVLCWGGNTFGELGIGSTDSSDHPTPQAALVDAPIFTDNFDGN